ncbi:MAG TPA: cation:proton antiporter [Steroidobacteraceae bacterium]|nr:cation:proton antiporter [Steroidobacteraceae bacterium]
MRVNGVGKAIVSDFDPTDTLKTGAIQGAIDPMTIELDDHGTGSTTGACERTIERGVPMWNLQDTAFLSIGALILLIIWLPLVLKRLPLSLPIICVGLGFAIFKLGLLPGDWQATADQRTTELIAETVVLIALMGAGLKIDRPFGWRRWQTTWRLLGLAMPACIGGLTLLAHYVGHFSWPAALLIGAALAPTDPVLAGAVEVGPPGQGEEGEVRFGLTSEAGLNDGLAFPFVALAIAMANGEYIGIGWVADHFVWRLLLSAAIGIALGRLFGALISRMSDRAPSEQAEGLLAIGITFIAFAISELVEAYGFVCVFITALTLRASCPSAAFHRTLWDFSSQMERLLAMLLLVMFGGALAMTGLKHLSVTDALIGLSLLLVLRPLFGWLALLGSPHPAVSRAATAFFGIRGIGTLYYIVYALGHEDLPEAGRIASLVAFVVVTSIVLHGMTATPIMRRLDRMRASASSQ